MSRPFDAFTRRAPLLLSILRIVTGFLYFQAGAAKIFGWFGGMPGGGTVPFASQMGIGGTLEVVCGLLIAVGLFVRPLSFLMSGQMAVAYWQFHAPHGTWPTQNQGVSAVLFCFVFLYLAAAGGGSFGVDAWRSARTRPAP